MKNIPLHKYYLSELPPLIPIDRVAELLDLTRRSVIRLLSEGRLVSTKITRSTGTSRRSLFLRESLEKLIQMGIDGE